MIKEKHKKKVIEINSNRLLIPINLKDETHLLKDKDS